MARFKAKSVINLKRVGKATKTWNLESGSIKTWGRGLYLILQKMYRIIEDKDRIMKIRVEVTREK